MAARLNRRHQQSVREKIRASQLANRLQNHVLGKVDMKSTQVKAAEYLISQAIGSPSQKLEHGGSIEVRRLVINGE